MTLIACTATPSALIDNDRIHVTILHFNDIYEITPVSGGKEGGIARVATLRKQLLARNPNTITTLGGDLFSPSAIGTAQYEGDRLAGRQIIASARSALTMCCPQVKSPSTMSSGYCLSAAKSNWPQ